MDALMMKSSAVFAALTCLAGCAAQPRPCTAEWMEWKTAEVIDDFADDHRKEIETLRRSAAMFGPEGGLDPSGGVSMTVLGLTGVIGLVADFMEEAAPAANDALRRCGSPAEASLLFASMLRREGVDERTVRAIESYGHLFEGGR